MHVGIFSKPTAYLRDMFNYIYLLKVLPFSYKQIFIVFVLSSALRKVYRTLGSSKASTILNLIYKIIHHVLSQNAQACVFLYPILDVNCLKLSYVIQTLHFCITRGPSPNDAAVTLIPLSGNR
jgi:hypothetical protein